MSERASCTCETFGNGVVSGNDGRMLPPGGCPKHGTPRGWMCALSERDIPTGLADRMAAVLAPYAAIVADLAQLDDFMDVEVASIWRRARALRETDTSRTGGR